MLRLNFMTSNAEIKYFGRVQNRIQDFRSYGFFMSNKRFTTVWFFSFNFLSFLCKEKNKPTGSIKLKGTFFLNTFPHDRNIRIPFYEVARVRVAIAPYCFQEGQTFKIKSWNQIYYSSQDCDIINDTSLSRSFSLLLFRVKGKLT